MKLNCKPGDLAVIVHFSGWGTAGRISKMLIGRIVRVVSLVPPSSDFECYSPLVWKFEKEIDVVVDGKKFTANGIADKCLRPIRDPGEDAQDETLQWLDVPRKVAA